MKVEDQRYVVFNSAERNKQRAHRVRAQFVRAGSMLGKFIYSFGLKRCLLFELFLFFVNLLDNGFLWRRTTLL